MNGFNETVLLTLLRSFRKEWTNMAIIVLDVNTINLILIYIFPKLFPLRFLLFQKRLEITDEVI